MAETSPPLPRPQGNSPDQLYAWAQQLMDMLSRGLPVPVYSTTNKPGTTERPPGTVVYVQDEAAGQKFQGLTIGAWVNLG